MLLSLEVLLILLTLEQLLLHQLVLSCLLFNLVDVSILTLIGGPKQV